MNREHLYYISENSLLTRPTSLFTHMDRKLLTRRKDLKKQTNSKAEVWIKSTVKVSKILIILPLSEHHNFRKNVTGLFTSSKKFKSKRNEYSLLHW